MFLRLMGAGFLLGGLYFAIFMPIVRLMGSIWIGVGVVLIVVAQFAAAAEAHRKRLLHTGKQGRATILSVTDTGITINKSPRVRVVVRIDVPGEPSVQGTRGMMVSRISPPRVGSVYSCRFDPTNPNDFVFEDSPTSYAAAANYGVAPPTGDDPLLRDLERLTKLRDTGALTSDEFEEQKRRLLHKTS